MAHLNSIGAGIYSDLAIAIGADGNPPSLAAVAETQAGFDALFATEGNSAVNSFVRVKNVREFPAMGTPPNIVNVPVFGQATSQQIQGQADAPSMEVTLNYVATDWAVDATLGKLVQSGTQLLVRFALLNAEPTATTNVKYASSAAGLGTRPNTYWYFKGKIDSLLVTPSLTDSNQATVAFTLQSKLFGAYTI